MYLQYANDHGIYSTFSNTSAPAIRAEFAAILSSALPGEALEPRNYIEDSAIPDVSAPEEYAEEIYRLYRAGVLTGSDAQGSFHPATNITRGAACAIAARMCNPVLRKEFSLIDVQPAPASSTIPTPTPAPDSNGSGLQLLDTPIPGTAYYVVNTNAFKFHYPRCRSVRDMYA